MTSNDRAKYELLNSQESKQQRSVDISLVFWCHAGGIFPNLVLIIEIIKMKGKKPPPSPKNNEKPKRCFLQENLKFLVLKESLAKTFN
jgi:hypothetical protein